MKVNGMDPTGRTMGVWELKPTLRSSQHSSQDPDPLVDL